VIPLLQTPKTIGNQLTTMVQPTIGKDKRLVQQVIVLMTTRTHVNIEKHKTRTSLQVHLF
jgi:hypothetical protein